jgi:hypothetical protein
MRVGVRRFLAVLAELRSTLSLPRCSLPGSSACRLHRAGNKTTDGRVLPAKFSPSRVVRLSGLFVSGSLLSVCVVPARPFRQPDMVFLFVGSSALTGGFLPTNLAIPQLLRSNVLAIVPLVLRSPTTVFTHRVAFHPISSRPCQAHHHPAAANPAIAPQFQSGGQWRGIAEPERSTSN